MIFKGQVKRTDYTNALEFLSRKHPHRHQPFSCPSRLLPIKKIKAHANIDSKGGKKMSALMWFTIALSIVPATS
jgi:hypothetical protein